MKTPGLMQSIEQLYKVFGAYRIDDLSKVGCFDYGPNAEELAGISVGLRDIPDTIVEKMEFYDESWETWGTKEEVKYFLPRIFRYLADDIGRLEHSGLFSLFKYKLKNCLNEKSQDWPATERETIEKFFAELLEAELSEAKDPGSVIECAMATGLSPEKILKNWKPNEATRKAQLSQIFEYFYVGHLKECASIEELSHDVQLISVKGGVLEDPAKTKAFLIHLGEKMTPDDFQF